MTVLSPSGSRIVTLFARSPQGAAWQASLAEILVSVKKRWKGKAGSGIGEEELESRVLTPDPVGDAVVSVFTSSVFRAEVLPLVRSWVLDADAGMFDVFSSCFTSLGYHLAVSERREKSSKSESESLRSRSVLPGPSVDHGSMLSLISKFFGPELASTVPRAEELRDEEWCKSLYAYHIMLKGRSVSTDSMTQRSHRSVLFASRTPSSARKKTPASAADVYVSPKKSSKQVEDGRILLTDHYMDHPSGGNLNDDHDISPWLNPSPRKALGETNIAIEKNPYVTFHYESPELDIDSSDHHNRDPSNRKWEEKITNPGYPPSEVRDAEPVYVIDEKEEDELMIIINNLNVDENDDDDHDEKMIDFFDDDLMDAIILGD